MDKQKKQILGIILTSLIVLAESATLVRRHVPKYGSPKEKEIGKDRRAWIDRERGVPSILDVDGYDSGMMPPRIPPSNLKKYDDTNEIERDEIDERFPSNLDRDEEDPKFDDDDEEENFDDGEDVPPKEELEGNVSHESDGKLPVLPASEDDEESIHKNADESPVDEEDEEEGDDKTENIPDDTNSWGGFGDSSIFDSPFFHLDQVQKYFRQLEKALGHVFRQTLDEARLLNGTYANTTEEEVDIDGQKYTVQKSVIKGADNHSSIYVETLSSRPKGVTVLIDDIFHGIKK